MPAGSEAHSNPQGSPESGSNFAYLGSPNVPCHRESDLSNRKHERFLEFELSLKKRMERSSSNKTIELQRWVLPQFTRSSGNLIDRNSRSVSSRAASLEQYAETLSRTSGRLESTTEK
jgi:hypothetical protein